MIKRFNKFNEKVSSDITITMDDFRKLKKSNLDNSLGDDNILIASPCGLNSFGKWNNKEVQILDLSTEDDNDTRELGYAVAIDGNIEYLIGLEFDDWNQHSSGFNINDKHGCVTFYSLVWVRGDESTMTIIQLWLEDGEFEWVAG